MRGDIHVASASDRTRFNGTYANTKISVFFRDWMKFGSFVNNLTKFEKPAAVGDLPVGHTMKATTTEAMIGPSVKIAKPPRLGARKPAAVRPSPRLRRFFEAIRRPRPSRSSVPSTTLSAIQAP